MSKERQRTRAAREAARRAEQEREAATRKRTSAQQRRRGRARAAVSRPPRRRRYGAMPTRHRLVLAAGWLAVQAVGWQLLPRWEQRLGLALLSLLALPLAVTLWFSPRSSR